MYGPILASCSYDRRVIIWKETGGRWSKLHEHASHDSSVNSVCWAPYELGLVLVCCSSDGSVSVVTYTAAGTWDAKKINNAHTVSPPARPSRLGREGGRVMVIVKGR